MRHRGKAPEKNRNTPGVPPITIDEHIDFWVACKNLNSVEKFARLIKLAHKVLDSPKHERL